MGYIGFHLKGNIFCFLTNLQFIQFLAILFGLFNLSVCLFEDQIGKFDWKQNYVGQIKFAHFDTVSTAKKIIIATEENVVAALNFKSGQILWRQVLEKAQNGQIQYLHVDSEVVTVSGQSPWLVRTWDPITGRLLWEWSLILTSAVRAKKVYWLVSHGKLIQVVFAEGGVLEVTKYNIFTGENKGGTKRISTPWINDISRCVLTGSIFACISGSDSNTAQMYYMNLSSDDNKVKTYPIQKLIGAVPGEVTISVVNGIVPGIILTRNNVHRVVLLNDAEPNALSNSIPSTSSLLAIEYNQDNLLLYTTIINSTIKITAISLDKNKVLPELTASLEKHAVAELQAGLCALKRDGTTFCRYLLKSQDDTVHLVQNSGKFLWSREEALSHIVAVDLLDLPVSDLDASIETEFDNSEGDFVGMLTRRLISQMKQLRLLLFTILGGKTQKSAAQEADLVRDEFGLHKIIIAVTKVGKIYGIDNLSGKFIWNQYIENIETFTSSEKDIMILYVQRTTRHLPFSAQCVLLAKDKTTGNGVIYIFNPITGEPVGKGLIRTNYKIQQAILIHKMNEEFLRPLLVLDDKINIHMYPENTNSVTLEIAKQTFIFTADTEIGMLTGYAINFDDNEKPVTIPTWQLKLGSKEHKIKEVVGKSLLERVHSQGRVLIDRSVLYKYVNPNLVAVLTYGPDRIHKYVSNIYLVDVVSGVIVASISHKRAREPIHLVHSENWLVYSYFNDKWRRTEIGTLELYEGKTQSNDTAFSSLAPPQLPTMERQSYILPSQVETMQVTITEKGITSKHVLMALGSGGVVEMPWMFLDPRRPATVTPEMREEGVVPYIPELPVPYEAIINYNQTLSRIRGIHTSPSGLESTCLVLVHGLDIFYTRVAPSKTFDLLKDDFDYYLIVIVLSILVMASYVTKHLASRKALRQAWK